MPGEQVEIHTKQVVGEDSSGSITSGKRGTLRKFMKLLSPEDPKAMMTNVIKNVVEPSIRKGIVDAVSTYVLGRPVFGNNPITQAINSIQNGTPYHEISNGTLPAIKTDVLPQPVSSGPRFDGKVFFKDPYTPRRVLEELNSVLGEYHRVRLIELYDCARIPGAEYVSTKYGWTDLSSAYIYAYADGYVLELPPVKYIG